VKRIMVDLETLGLQPSAVVLSIGLVQFNEKEILDNLHVKLAIDPQIEAGRSIDGSTLDWWMNQEPNARHGLFSGAAQQSRLLVEDGLQLVWKFMQNVDELWGNGAAFDNVVLRHLFMQFKGLTPWSYKADRCYRTVRSMNNHVPFPTFQGVEHNALDDARHQTIHLQLMLWGNRDDAERATDDV